MTRYQMNTPSIIAEILDGEVVILNLEKGIYYSLGGIGTSLWEMVTSGLTIQEIAKSFHPSDTLEKDLQVFTEQLLEKNLITTRTDPTAPILTASEDKLTFAQPVLHVYEDMKELLLLDPIHEVDQAGWPLAP